MGPTTGDKQLDAALKLLVSGRGDTAMYEKKDLSKYSAIELEKALEQKRADEKEENKPKILYNARRHIYNEETDVGQFTPLINIVRRHIDDIAAGNYHPDSDDDHYIFEAAVEAVYGKQIWRWYRENT